MLGHHVLERAITAEDLDDGRAGMAADKDARDSVLIAPGQAIMRVLVGDSARPLCVHRGAFLGRTAPADVEDTGSGPEEGEYPGPGGDVRPAHDEDERPSAQSAREQHHSGLGVDVASDPDGDEASRPGGGAGALRLLSGGGALWLPPDVGASPLLLPGRAMRSPTGDDQSPTELFLTGMVLAKSFHHISL